MNQRIQELSEQASLYAVSDNSAMLFDVWKKRYTEKFAELIVRECAEVVQEGRWMVPPSQEQLATSIKQHFGVE